MWRSLPPSAIKRNQGHLTSFSCYRAKYRSLPPPLSQYTYGLSLLYPNKVWTPPPPLPTPALATTTTTATPPPSSSRVVWFAPCLSFPLLLFSLRRRGERERLLSLLLPFPQCFLLFPPPPFPALRSLSLPPSSLFSPHRFFHSCLHHHDHARGPADGRKERQKERSGVSRRRTTRVGGSSAKRYVDRWAEVRVRVRASVIPVRSLPHFVSLRFDSGRISLMRRQKSGREKPRSHHVRP